MQRVTYQLRAVGKLTRRDGECWVWTGACTKDGYGTVMTKGPRRVKRLHRLSYELMVGPIPAGLEIDHACNNPPCFNPAHLRAVTGLENVRSAPKHYANKKFCKHGHALDGRRSISHRYCRTCDALRKREVRSLS